MIGDINVVVNIAGRELHISKWFNGVNFFTKSIGLCLSYHIEVLSIEFYWKYCGGYSYYAKPNWFYEINLSCVDCYSGIIEYCSIDIESFYRAYMNSFNLLMDVPDHIKSSMIEEVIDPKIIILL